MIKRDKSLSLWTGAPRDVAERNINQGIEAVFFYRLGNTLEKYCTFVGFICWILVMISTSISHISEILSTKL
jgi:hypothetical protein